jgi:hypothetical protein
MRGPGAQLTGGTGTVAAELYISRKAHAHNRLRSGMAIGGRRKAERGSSTIDVTNTKMH